MKDAVEKSVRLKKSLGCIAICIATVLLILATMVAVVEGIAFNRDFYKEEYDKLNSAAYVGVSRQTLEEATDTLLRYLEGDRESLDMAAEVGGQEREYYNLREKQHMVDVAVLNQNAVKFMMWAYPIGIALVILGALLIREARLVWKTSFFSIVGVLVAFGVLAVWAAADFTSFWIQFHHVFFSNDLWQFDPESSLLIRMFEETFFFDMVGRILVVFISIVLAALVLTGVMYRKGQKAWQIQQSSR